MSILSIVLAVVATGLIATVCNAQQITVNGLLCTSANAVSVTYNNGALNIVTGGFVLPSSFWCAFYT